MVKAGSKMSPKPKPEPAIRATDKKKQSAPRTKSKPRRLSKSKAQSTHSHHHHHHCNHELLSSQKTTECVSNEEQQSALHENQGGDIHAAKKSNIAETAVCIWQDILQLTSQEGDLNHVEKVRESPYLEENMRTWNLPNSDWDLEAMGQFQGETDILVENAETLINGPVKEKGDEQLEDLPSWILQADIDGQPPLDCSSGKDCAPVCSKSDAHQALYPGRKRKSTVLNTKKDFHILVERERRKCMNDLFAIVKSLLPKPMGKQDKATLLSDFIEYIRAHQRKVEGLKKKRGDLETVKCLPPNLNPTQKSAGTTATSNTCQDLVKAMIAASPPSPTSLLKQNPLAAAAVVPYLKMQASEKDTFITMSCMKDPRICVSVLGAMTEHQLDLMTAHISSTEAMLVHNFHCQVRKGSSFCKDNFHSRLQQLIGIQSNAKDGQVY